ncbi:MAG: hypothetical protein K2L18_07125, partial [Acetatifactor sp.]|nr:hypothetical protein [Acetatifactor sp.]
KDEDFSDYYCTYNSCDYKGTGIRLRAEGEVSSAERELLSLITASGAITDSSYELIEYINDVNREYAEVLVEQNINGTLDTAYVYGAAIGAGADRLSLDHFDSTGYYLYDPRGSVTGITNEEGQIYQSYRYSVFGEITFGESQYENEYTYNGESYNPNIKSQYLRARYYCVVTADFLTEDSYLGDITKPLTLNRYNYCVGSPLNYVDPSGNWVFEDEMFELTTRYFNMSQKEKRQKKTDLLMARKFLSALHELQMPQASIDYAISYDYAREQSYVNHIIAKAYRKNKYFACEIFHVTLEQLEDFGWRAFKGNKEDYIIKFNRVLNEYGITKKSGITMFMATMAHESNFGIDNIEGMRNGIETLTEENWDEYIAKVNPGSTMKFDERGAGYIQLSWKDAQETFLNDIGAYEDMLVSEIDRVHYIADNYSLEASTWFWGTTRIKNTRAGSLNDYANTYGNTEGIFLITQYFVNSYTANDADLASIREGGEYEIKDGKLIVNNHSYALPENWEDRSEKYKKAYEIFGK